MTGLPQIDFSRKVWIFATGAFGLIFLAVGIAALNFANPANALIPLVMSAAGCLALFYAFFQPMAVFYGFIMFSMFVPHELEDLYLPFGFMKLYVHDVVFGFMLLYGTWQYFFCGATFHGLKFNRLLLLYLFFGLCAAAIGLWRGNEYDYVFGDLRRSFFYFTAFFITLVSVRNRSDINTYFFCILAGSILAIAKGILQILSGDFIMRRYGDAAHILNHFEVTFSSLAIYYALYRLISYGTGKLKWALLAVMGTIVVILANYRTCWIGLSGGLIIFFALLPFQQRIKVTVCGLAIALITFTALGVSWDIPVGDNNATIGENVKAKLNLYDTTVDSNLSWRLDSYQNAFALWQANPLIGQGLGKNLEFITATSTGGSMMAMGHRVHNSYLWILMSLGLFGFLVFATLHGRFIILCVTTAKHHSYKDERLAILLPLFCLYSTIMISALFDVYLESSPPITIISVIMAVSLLLIENPSYLREAYQQ